MALLYPALRTQRLLTHNEFPVSLLLPDALLTKHRLEESPADAISQRASPLPRVSAVTGEREQSYYILGSRTKLASWTAPGVSLLDLR